MLKVPRNRGVVIAVAVIIVLAMAGAIQAGPSFPAADGAVSDYIQLLSETEVGRLEAISHELLDKTGAALVVAIIDTLGDRSLEDYATDLFGEWGIGTQEDNGVLILLAMREREVAIEVGYGLEDTLTDARSGTVLRELMLPAFGQDEFFEGMDKGMRAIATIIASRYGVNLEAGGAYSVAQIDSRAHSGSRDIFGVVMMLGLGVGLIALGTAKFGQKCPQCKGPLMVTQRILKRATHLTTGTAVKTYQCRQCGYRNEKTHITPRLGRTPGMWLGPRGGGMSRGGARGGGFGGLGGGRSGGGGARGRF